MRAILLPFTGRVGKAECCWETTDITAHSREQYDQSWCPT